MDDVDAELARCILWSLFAAALANRPATGSVQGLAIRPSATAIATEADDLLAHAMQRYPFLAPTQPEVTP